MISIIILFHGREGYFGMEEEKRTIRYDNGFKTGAHHLEGVTQKFPSRFHEYCVLGFVESGGRGLTCKNREYADPAAEAPARADEEIQAAREYMENNYAGQLSLDDLRRISGLNKYALLRNFTLQRGITPYRYLSAILVNIAKKLLEAGVSPTDAAPRSGFTEQRGRQRLEAACENKR